MNRCTFKPSLNRTTIAIARSLSADGVRMCAAAPHRAAGWVGPLPTGARELRTRKQRWPSWAGLGIMERVGQERGGDGGTVVTGGEGCT